MDEYPYFYIKEVNEMKKIVLYILLVICCVVLIGCNSVYKEKEHNYYVVELKDYNDVELKKLQDFGSIKETFKVIQTVTLEVKENKLSALKKNTNVKNIQKVKNIKEIEKKEKRHVWSVDIKKEQSNKYINNLSHYGEILKIDKEIDEYNNTVTMILSEKSMLKMFEEKDLNHIYKKIDEDDPDYQKIYVD